MFIRYAVTGGWEVTIRDRIVFYREPHNHITPCFVKCTLWYDAVAFFASMCVVVFDTRLGLVVWTTAQSL